MKRLSITVVVLFLFSICALPVLAADTFDLVIPLPLTGKPAKFGEIMKRSYGWRPRRLPWLSLLPTR